MAKKVIDKCNIFKQQCKTVLNEGEEICPSCHGHGGFFISIHPKDRAYKIRECIICLGEGKIDWITATNKMPKAIHSKIKFVGMRCPRHRGSKCKSMKRLWKQKNMKDEIRMWQEY